MVNKFEIQISKLETNPRSKCSNFQRKKALRFEFSRFKFVSNFGFCASDLDVYHSTTVTLCNLDVNWQEFK